MLVVTSCGASATSSLATTHTTQDPAPSQFLEDLHLLSRRR
uniref:Uncharacterized protein n=1 Tax=Arundo donax TaxID=35708 RepID=A0A0A9AWJ7_ARUDO